VTVHGAVHFQQLPIHSLESIFKAAERVSWRGSLHQSKAAEMLRRLSGVKKRVIELELRVVQLLNEVVFVQQTVFLFKGV
jgi:hypothetical protein